MKAKQTKITPLTSSDWLQYAQSDLKLAELASTNKDIHFELACFHTQQAVEKALKALMIENSITFPLTHDIQQLLELIEQAGLNIPREILDVDQLTPYAVETRYPGLYEEISEEEMKVALELSRKTVQWVQMIIDHDSK